MKKLIIAATAIAAVALSSGCRHVVVRSHQPVEVVNTRTVVHEHTDVHVHDHTDVHVHEQRQPPHRTTRIIRETHPAKPEVVYVPAQRGHGEPPRHARERRYPRPPEHSNSRHYREKAPNHSSRHYGESRRQGEPRYRNRHADPAPRVITPHDGTAASRAMQETHRRHTGQASAPAPSAHNRDERNRYRQREVVRQQPQTAPAPRRDNRHTQVRDKHTKQAPARRQVRKEHRTPLRAAAEKFRNAPPKSAPQPSDRRPPQRTQGGSRAKDKAARNGKQEKSGTKKKERDDKRGKGRHEEADRD